MFASAGWRTDLLALTAILALTLIVFSGSFDSEFVYDDLRQVVRNPLIQDPSLAWQAMTSDVWAFKGDGSIATSNYWRPTFTGFNILCFRLFRLDPYGWHVASVVLHLVVCAALYVLLRQWKRKPGLAAAVTLLFAVHPVQTESVVWVAGSPNLLAGGFLIAALACATRFADNRRPLPLLASLALYALALGAKEVSLLCFPMFWLIFRWNRRQRSSARRVDAVAATVPFALLATTYFLLRWWLLDEIVRPQPEAVSPLSTALSAPSVFLFYLGQILMPVQLGPGYALRPVLHPGAADFWLLLIVALAIGLALLALGRQSTAQTLGLALFGLALAPAFNLTAFRSDQIVHDRYLYLPLFGFLLLLAPSIERIVARSSSPYPPRLLAGTTMLVAIMLALRTASYAPVWENDLALWQHGVKVDPGSSFNWTQYGAALAARGRHDEAVAAFDKALAAGSSPRARLGRGRSLTRTGEAEQAASDLLQVIDDPPEDLDTYLLYQAYEALAIAYTALGEPGLAEVTLRHAQRRLPIYAAALAEKLAIVLYQEDRKPEALQVLIAAEDRARTELLPESKAVLLRLAMLSVEQGNTAVARRYLLDYMELTEPLEDVTTVEQRELARAILEELGQ